MSYKLIALLIAVVVALLGLTIALLTNKPAATPAPVAVEAPPPPPEQPKPNPHGGYYKKSKPGSYGYTTPK